MSTPSPERAAGLDRRLAWLVGGVTAVVYGVAAWLRSGYQPEGDEPHYLILGLALGRYGSIDPTPVYQNQDYRSFFPFPIDPHMLVTDAGFTVPLHNSGGPLLWLPAQILAGRAGVAAFLVLVSTLVVVNIFLLLRRLGVGPGVAVATTLLFAVGTPLYVYAPMFYVEMIAALLVIYAARQLLAPAPSGWRLGLASAGLGYLPFVHGRFAIFTLSLGALVAVRVYRDLGWRDGWAYGRALGPLVVVLGAVEALNLHLYGTLNPAPGNASLGDGLFRIPFYDGLLYLSFDRVYGLVPYFPIVVLALPGILLALRRGAGWTNVVLLGALLPYTLAMATFGSWWAGFSPPARFLCVVMPLLAYYVAVLLERVPFWLGLIPAALAAAYSFVVAFASDLRPADRFDSGLNNGGLMLERVGRAIGLPSLPELFPSVRIPGEDGRLFAGWTIAVLVAAVALLLVGRGRQLPSGPPPATGNPVDSMPRQRSPEAAKVDVG